MEYDYIQLIRLRLWMFFTVITGEMFNTVGLHTNTRLTSISEKEFDSRDELEHIVGEETHNNSNRSQYQAHENVTSPFSPQHAFTNAAISSEQHKESEKTNQSKLLHAYDENGLNLVSISIISFFCTIGIASIFLVGLSYMHKSLKSNSLKDQDQEKESSGKNTKPKSKAGVDSKRISRLRQSAYHEFPQTEEDILFSAGIINGEATCLRTILEDKSWKSKGSYSVDSILSMLDSSSMTLSPPLSPLNTDLGALYQTSSDSDLVTETIPTVLLESDEGKRSNIPPPKIDLEVAEI